MIKVIIFDWGGVFSKKTSLRDFCDDYAKTHNLNAEAMKKLIIELWLEARVGKGDKDMFFNELAAFSKTEVSKFKHEFISFFPFNQELFDFVREDLQGNYKLGILSNNIQAWFEPIISEYKLDELFNVITTSYGSKSAKPDLKIFKDTLKEHNVKAQECIFIDDLPKNFPPAKELGFHVIPFKNTQQCIEELTRFLNEDE